MHLKALLTPQNRVEERVLLTNAMLLLIEMICVLLQSCERAIGIPEVAIRVNSSLTFARCFFDFIVAILNGDGHP
jgi:hypothetical protein